MATGKNSFRDRLAASKEALKNKMDNNKLENIIEENNQSESKIDDAIISDNSNNIENENIDKDNTESQELEPVETTETITIVEDKAVKDTQIITQESTYTQLMKGNNLASKVFKQRKKQKEHSELDELFEIFEGMTRNEIVKLCVGEIEKVRDKDIKRRMLAYTKKKPALFKDRMKTVSIPARDEMHTLLDIISSFSGNTKYLLLEEIILKGLKYMDFDNDEFEEDYEDDE